MPRSARLYLLHDDDAVLRSARHVRPAAVRCATWEELGAALRSAPPTAQVLVDPFHGSPGAPAAGLRDMLAALPSACVVAALRLEPGRMRDVQTLREWGVAEVAALPAEEGPHALDHILARCRARAFLRAVNASMPRYLSGRAAAMLLVAAQTAHAGGGARSLGRALALGRAGLVRACAREGLPAPGRLMRWMRALVVAQLLDDPARTPALVARSCGYRGPDALLAALAPVLVGAGGVDLAQGRAFAQVAAALHREAQGLREALREDARERRARRRSGGPPRG
jgi:hypothetical protein